METSLFDYHLPPERIAQHSVEPRDQAKLLLLDRKTGGLRDRHIFDLPNLLKEGDLLVFNDSKVFRARLHGKRAGRTHELFLLNARENGEGQWSTLISNAKKLREGDLLTLADGTNATLVLKNVAEGTCTLNFHRSNAEVFALTEAHGEIPTPPYVDGSDMKTEDYQTVYAKNVGSVAAPTAGFHFTPELLKALKEKGIQQAFVTLHVGVGTFRPVKAENVRDHVMHKEWVQLPETTARAINRTKEHGGRVIAVGTTTLRVLETFHGKTGEGWTDIFITPGYGITTVHGLITNFHLPKSTLLMLVSALAGREHVLAAYDHAIKNNYRFYSFGDAMLIT